MLNLLQIIMVLICLLEFVNANIQRTFLIHVSSNDGMSDAHEAPNSQSEIWEILKTQYTKIPMSIEVKCKDVEYLKKLIQSLRSKEFH